jgi:hypothetical protein
VNDDLAIEICTMQPVDGSDGDDWVFGEDTKYNALLRAAAPRMLKLLAQYKTITDIHNNEAQDKLIDLQYAVNELFDRLSD